MPDLTLRDLTDRVRLRLIGSDYHVELHQGKVQISLGPIVEAVVAELMAEGYIDLEEIDI